MNIFTFRCNVFDCEKVFEHISVQNYETGLLKLHCCAEDFSDFGERR